MRKPVTLTRQELFDLVWSEPVSRVAERYEVSGVWLKKVCRVHDVPVPPRGYWARVAAGQAPEKPRLPKPASADERVMLRSPFTNPWNLQALRESKAVERGEAVRARKAFEADPANKIVVKADDSARHVWAREVEKGLRRGSRHLAGGEALAHASVGGNALSVSVSPPLFERAVSIVDALAKASVDRGYLPARRPSGGSLRFAAEGVPLRVDLKEKLLRYELPKPKKPPRTFRERFEAEYGPRYGFKPSGVLQLRVFIDGDRLPVTKTFSDTDASRLEDRLNDVMVAYVQVALRHQAREERLRREREAREAEWRRAEEERRRQEAEAARFRQLEELALRWERAERLRRFIADVRARGRTPAIEGTPTDLGEWERWASGWADRLDPLA